jgi:hypothetical protein
MSGRRRTLLAAASAVLALSLSLGAAGPVWGWNVKLTPIASGLDNPRDLAMGPDGHLYVAEAGHGGKECFTAPGPGGETETSCIGFTGGISRIDSEGPDRVLSGVASMGEPSGFGAEGLSGVSFIDNRLFAVEGLNGELPAPPGLSPKTAAAAKAQFGRLGEVTAPNQVRIVANVGGFDFQWSKEHKSLVPEQFPDANPYAVLATKWGELVVDAASNTLDFVSPSGAVSVQAFIPNPPVSDSVPTCLDKGPDGAIYIGQLTGVPNKPGAANIWRWVPGHEPTVWASGLTDVTGCGFGPAGHFYAVEFTTLGLEHAAPGTGALVRVPASSTSPVTLASGLNFPGGFAAGKDAIYFSEWSIAPAQSKGGSPTGQVIRVSRG